MADLAPSWTPGPRGDPSDARTNIEVARTPLRPEEMLELVQSASTSRTRDASPDRGPIDDRGLTAPIYLRSCQVRHSAHGAHRPASLEKEVLGFLTAHAEPIRPNRITCGEGSDAIGNRSKQSPDEEKGLLTDARAGHACEFDNGFSWVTGPANNGGRELPVEYERRRLGPRGGVQLRRGRRRRMGDQQPEGVESGGRYADIGELLCRSNPACPNMRG